MRKADPKAFGARVRQRREELGWSQAKLGKESGYAQQNIVWIEGGGPKRPERAASALADVLQTTREWLLFGQGARVVGPQFLTAKELVERYEALSPERKAAISRAIQENPGKGRRIA